jgi:hypothetical protein
MARRKGRRSFGSLRQLPSGRWQARDRDAAGKSHTAPETFTTRPEAARFLAQVETDLARGEWTDPRAGRLSFAEWAARWQATTTNLRAQHQGAARLPAAPVPATGLCRHAAG